MKLTEAGLNILMDNDAITFDTHERVPFFVVDDTTLWFEDQGEEVTEGEYIVNLFYTETHLGVTYVKMDSTSKNPDGTFNGAEPTYSNTMSLDRQKLFKEQLGTAVSANEMMLIRKVGAMTLEEYKAYMVERLRDDKDDVTFKAVVVSDAKGEDLNYTINLVKSVELKTMIDDAIKNGSDVVATHDDSRTMHESYTLAEAEELYKDVKLGIAKRAAIYDVFITRAANMTEKLPVDQLTSMVFTEDEQSYIDMIAYEI